MVLIAAWKRVALERFAQFTGRLHDVDRTGWWLLIALIPLVGAIVLIIFHATAGNPGPNAYGPTPDPLPA